MTGIPWFDIATGHGECYKIDSLWQLIVIIVGIGFMIGCFIYLEILPNLKNKK